MASSLILDDEEEVSCSLLTLSYWTIYLKGCQKSQVLKILHTYTLSYVYKDMAL